MEEGRISIDALQDRSFAIQQTLQVRYRYLMFSPSLRDHLDKAVTDALTERKKKLLHSKALEQSLNITLLSLNGRYRGC